MAPRQRPSILPALTGATDQADDAGTAEAPGEEKPTPPPARKAGTRSSRTSSRASTNRKAADSAGGKRTEKSAESKSSGAAGGKRTEKSAAPARRSRASSRSAAPDEHDAVLKDDQGKEIRALWTGTADAERKSLYLHPDDAYALGHAKLEDKVDYNARIRAMIAVYRHNERFRKAVDRIARASPRGPRRREETQN